MVTPGDLGPVGGGMRKEHSEAKTLRNQGVVHGERKRIVPGETPKPWEPRPKTTPKTPRFGW